MDKEALVSSVAMGKNGDGGDNDIVLDWREEKRDLELYIETLEAKLAECEERYESVLRDLEYERSRSLLSLIRERL